MAKFYDAMPEDYYQLSKLHVIGPEDTEAWVKQMTRSGYKSLHSGESMSG